MPAYPPRRKVPRQHAWNAESVFPNPAAWETELRSILDAIPRLGTFHGRLNKGPGILLEALRARDDLQVRAERVVMYASFAQAVDTTDQVAAAMQSRAGSMQSQVASAAAFVAPELISIGHHRIKEWMHQEPDLAVYGHHFDDLFRRQAHVRSSEVEALLGMVIDPFEGPSVTAMMLTNADFTFQPAVDHGGKSLRLTQGSLRPILELPDRVARQSAWNNYMDRHLEFRNTLASNLVTSIKANVFRSRARQHETSLAASLFEANVGPEVFHSTLDTFRKHLPVWHRYFEVRRKALRQRDIAYYDMWAPLGARPKKIPFAAAVDLIGEALQPLGGEYTATLRRGCLEQRWVDWVPNLGKADGAFSYGAPGTHPFIMMSFTDDVRSLSTLAHELGHSMHSYLTWRNQPLAYSEYSLFVAEVASNFHQAMVQSHVLETATSPALQIAIIEDAMRNFFRYFFLMPTLARFELETHRRIEKGDGLTAEDMCALMADLLAEALGPRVKLDRRRLGMVWSTFGHLFADYYVYQYATGIAGAHALSAGVLRGVGGAVDRYLEFLAAGGSAYPLDVLRRAGVDLTSPKPVEATFAVMEGYVDRLEQLLN